MSVERPTRDPDTAPIPRVGSDERKRAAIVLGVIALAAIVFVAILWKVLGGGGGGGGGPAPAAHRTGPAVVFSSSAPTTSHPSSSKPTTSAAPSTSTSASAGYHPSTRAVSCPSQAPCALPDDIGDLVGALNAYRAARHLPAVTGSVTPAATTCALSEASTCPSGFFWEPGARDGKAILNKMLSFDRGTARLVDPALKSVQVGWAYVPSSQSYECALVVGQ